METISGVLAERYSLTDPLVYYRDLFPLGCLDTRGAYTKGKYTATALQLKQDGTATKVLRHTICDDLDPIAELLETKDFIIISPVSYAGHSLKQKYARELYSITFDLDNLIVSNGVQVGLRNLIDYIDEEKLPRPTYIISSGNGIHVCYILDKPLRLYNNVLVKLNNYRTALTNALWRADISELWKEPQFESATQGFRAVGSVCKNGKTRVEAYLTGEKVSVDYLNTFVQDYEDLLLETDYKGKVSLEEAKELYPEWYESRVIAGNPRGTWTCNKALYEWWKRQIVDANNVFPSTEKGATDGHRYFAIMALAIYARKCGVVRETLEQDALSFIPLLDGRGKRKDNPFTEQHVMDALEAYNVDYITFPRDVIQRLTNIEIKANKRNYRKQSVHLKIARATKSILNESGEGNCKNAGRKSKKDLVANYLLEKPSASVRQCAKDLGIAQATAAKWLRILRNETNETNET